MNNNNKNEVCGACGLHIKYDPQGCFRSFGGGRYLRCCGVTEGGGYGGGRYLRSCGVMEVGGWRELSEYGYITR